MPVPAEAAVLVSDRLVTPAVEHLGGRFRRAQVHGDHPDRGRAEIDREDAHGCACHRPVATVLRPRSAMRASR